jgi:hypothetical protein
MTPHAERMRRCRQRRADGTVLARITIPADVIGELITLGWLRPDAPRSAAPQALVDLLDAALEARVMPARDLSRSTETFPGIGR